MQELKKVLIVLTNHASHTSGKPTGYWLSELTHFYAVLHAAGIEMDFASPKGGEPPMDPASREGTDVASSACLADPEFMQKLQHTKNPSEVNAAEYCAVYYPGGHGPMWDLATDKSIAAISAVVYEHQGIVSAVCHGPAGLLPIILVDGTPLLAGKTVAGFSNMEERLSGKTAEVPFLLEDALRNVAKKYTKAFLPFNSHVEVDGRVVTGQNPKSAKGVAEALLSLLKNM